MNVKDEDELLAVARPLNGQLSAAMQLEERDMPLAHRLLPVLERRTGRIVNLHDYTDTLPLPRCPDAHCSIP
ncbi:hypothetical protein ACYZTX_13930 [Pseudomonas sp. MDT1-17]